MPDSGDWKLKPREAERKGQPRSQKLESDGGLNIVSILTVDNHLINYIVS